RAACRSRLFSGPPSAAWATFSPSSRASARLCAARARASAPSRSIALERTGALTAKAYSLLVDMLGEERQDHVGEALADPVGVVAVVDFPLVLDAEFLEFFVDQRVVAYQAILVAHIEADGVEALESSDMAGDHGQRRIVRPFRHHQRVDLAILDRPVDVERRIVRVGRPGDRRGEARPHAEAGLIHALVRHGRHGTGGFDRFGARADAAGALRPDAVEDLGIGHADDPG